MKQSCHGSCHCGAVRFRCEHDLAQASTRCNCSICAKTRFGPGVVPAAQFELLVEQALLADYQCGQQQIPSLLSALRRQTAWPQLQPGLGR